MSFLFTYELRMPEKLTVTAQRLRTIMDETDWTQEDLATAAGVTQGTISLILTGKTQRSRLLPKIANILAINLSWLMGETDELIWMFDEEGDQISEDDLTKIRKGQGKLKLVGPPEHRPIGNDAQSTPTAATLVEQLDLVEVQEIDLRYGMGATDLEVPVTTSVRHFSRDWLRQYTSANPDAVYFAQGIGDSMMPTIHDSDLLLIDTSDNTMRLADQIWAVAHHGAGKVKRLRPTREGVEIHSDNPLVRPETAFDGELHILGRLVGIVRKM